MANSFGSFSPNSLSTSLHKKFIQRIITQINFSLYSIYATMLPLITANFQFINSERLQPENNQQKKNIYQIYLFCHSCLSSLKLNSLQPTLSLVHIFFSCSHCHQDSFFSVVLLVIYELSIRLQISPLFTLHILQNKLSLPLSCRCKPIWCLLDKQEKM